MPKIVNYGKFLETGSLQSNSVTRLVNFGGKCQILISFILSVAVDKCNYTTLVSLIARDTRVAHYSKSQIFVQKFNFDKTLQFFSGNPSCQQLKSANTQHFHEFSPKFFLTIFLVKSNLSTAQNSKTAAFSRVFTQNNWTIFLGKSKLNFWTKNEDFEQCEWCT